MLNSSPKRDLSIHGETGSGGRPFLCPLLQGAPAFHAFIPFRTATCIKGSGPHLGFRERKPIT